jgi:hypothetical protein
MAFRNPVHTLPASRITGQIQGSQLAADAIDGKLITGATIRTAASGHRILLAASGNQYFYTGAVNEVHPARIDPDASGILGIYGPRMDEMLDYGLTLKMTGADTTAVLDVNSTTIVGDAHVGGKFSAGNMVLGTVQIVPVANVDTSVTVSGVPIADASSYRVWTQAISGFPGQIEGVTVNGITNDGFTVWINRETATSTGIQYLMMGK